MAIIYKKGNLFTTDADIIIHGCNCQGVMGSGVAKQIKEKYPEAYAEYKRQEKRCGLKVGDISKFVNSTDGKIIINAMTQYNYGRDNQIYADYNGIRSCLRKISNEINFRKTIFNILENPTLAMPKIGCGLGGGDWNIVSKIIEEELVDFEVEIWEL